LTRLSTAHNRVEGDGQRVVFASMFSVDDEREVRLVLLFALLVQP
jgi:hypothetical protein